MISEIISHFSQWLPWHILQVTFFQKCFTLHLELRFPTAYTNSNCETFCILHLRIWYLEYLNMIAISLFYHYIYIYCFYVSIHLSIYSPIYQPIYSIKWKGWKNQLLLALQISYRYRSIFIRKKWCLQF